MRNRGIFHLKKGKCNTEKTTINSIFYHLPGKTGELLLTYKDSVKNRDYAGIGRTRILCSAGGFDVTLLASDMSYANIVDLRERFHGGDIKTAIVKSYDPETAALKLSVKEAEPHPYDGVELCHPINSRRASVITGKYLGGVFCRLEENLDCLCTYSPDQYDEDFHIGDQVIVVITKLADRKKKVFGKIVAKW